jgi:trans-2,3-dihydro-3-hydroxyanthranilate isomerase
MNYTIVDVFAVEKYGGNPLLVVEYTHDLPTEEMQAIAKEINFAESTFIDMRTFSETNHDVRIFTPGRELPFAGHPTLGTAWVVREKLLQSSVPTVTLNLPVGKIPVDFASDDVLWMTQKTPAFGQTYSHQAIADLFDVPHATLDLRFAPQVVSTGIGFIMVAFKHKADVKSLAPDAKKWNSFFEQNATQDSFVGVLAFCPETDSPQNHLQSRVFTIEHKKIVEDPATGSANGCLLAYLLETDYFKSPKLELNVEQGNEVPRPSVVYHSGQKIGEDFKIRIGGRVQKVALGVWGL